MPTKIWYCPFCGYEVPSRGRCHSCGERLLAAPLPELESGPDDDEVGYRLDDWGDEERARLIRLLVSARVPHRFEEEELVVLAADEAEVDKLVARATSAGLDEDEELGAAGPAPAPATEGSRAVSRALYEAAQVLREDPTDMKADVAFAEASAAVFAADYLPDMDEAQMAAVGRVTRRLLGALGADEALEDEIRHQAEVLCRLVALSAGEEPARAEAARALARLAAAAQSKGRPVALPRSQLTPAGEMGFGAQIPLETTETTGSPSSFSGAGLPFGVGTAPGAQAEPTGHSRGGAGAADGEVDGEVDGKEVPQGRGGAPTTSRIGPAETETGSEDAVVAGGRGSSRPKAMQGAAETGAEDAEAAGEVQALEQAGDEGSPVQGREAPLEPEDFEEEDEDSGEIVYELAEWLPEQRVELCLLVEAAGIPYSWEGTDLTVAAEHEAEVEALFGQVRGLADEDDEARYRAIEELFGSVDRLANDPGDEERQQAFLQAVGAVEQPTPVGVDDAFWWRVRSQGHAVRAALESGARLDEISREAALLAEMLHEMV
jgi:hypothetical protein